MTASDDGVIEGPDAESISALSVKLKNAREAQGLTIDEIAAELRIGANMLTALEESCFDELGAPVFAKGYLKQYGTRLGLDLPDLLADYERVVGDQSVEIAPSKTIRLRDERQITVWVIAAVALVLLAVVLWVWWWLGADQAIEPVADRAASEVVAPIEQLPVDEPPVLQPPIEQPTVVEAPPASVSAPAPASEPEPAPAPQPDLAPPALLESAEPTVAESLDEPSAAGPALEIVFVEDSWTEITSETGERLYYDLGRAGTRAEVPANQALNLFFGNAAGVSLTLNGEPFQIPPTARRGDLAQFNLEAVVE